MANEKLSILKLLVENQEERLSIRQISIRRNINYKSAYMAVKDLNREGTIDLIRQGNTIICKFNRSFNNSVFTVEYGRLQDLLKDKNFKVVHDRFSAIPRQFILLLFGSQVRKESTKHSDIDLLAITDDAQMIEREARLIPLKIHLTAIGYGDFIAMLKSKEMTVVSEALKNNIIIFGIEDYYRLMKNAV